MSCYVLLRDGSPGNSFPKLFVILPILELINSQNIPDGHNETC